MRSAHLIFSVALLAFSLSITTVTAVGSNAPFSTAIAADEDNIPNTTTEPDTPASDKTASNPEVGAEIGFYKYITDQLSITLRSGQSNKHKILRSLNSGTRLGLLEEAGEYSRVRTNSGIEGWVLSQYLVDSPGARQQLNQAEGRIQTLEKDKQQLRQEVEKLQRLTQSHLATKNDLIEKNDGLNIELNRIRSVTAEPLKLANEVTRVKQDNSALQKDNSIIKGELDKIRHGSEREWFMLGAGTIVLGVAIGLLAPQFRRRRKSDWDKL